MNWTPAQREAIEARGRNLLISAAAGSGKTTVLADRIVSLVKDGARIDEILVVTFTKAAAAEMRTRILDALHDAAEGGDKHLAAQAMRVERASISTLHGFCTQICRDHFQAAGVDPTFRVADTAEAAVLRERAMMEALTDCFERGSAPFSYAAACFQQPVLVQAVEDLYWFLMARPDPWQWLEEAIAAHHVSAESLAESPWMQVLISRVKMLGQNALAAYAALKRYAWETDLFAEFAALEATKAEIFCEAAESGYDALMALPALSFDARPRKKKDMDEAAVNRFASLRDYGKALLKDAYDALKIMRDLPLHAEDEWDIGIVLGGISEAVHAFHDQYMERKQEKNLLDFNDLEHFALTALRAPEVSENLRERYAHVFVDEYQDSSLLQEALLEGVSRGDNLFMVGDVKQSIYRFRMAEPSLFLRKLRAFQPDAAAKDRRIALNANFRSQPKLLKGINDVFEQVFSGDIMELTYEKDEQLIPGQSASDDDAPIELHLLMDVQDDDLDAPTAAELSQTAKKAVVQEAEVMAQRIHALVREEGYKYRDIAILMRTVRGKASQVVQTLRSRDIPAWSDLGEDALVRPEIQAVIALLQSIDNLRLDIPLLASLRGFALGLPDDALATIRAAQPEGPMIDAVLAYAEQSNPLADALRMVVERMRGWALDAQVLPLDALLRQIYNDTGHYAQSGARPDGNIRQANLRTLAEHAGAFQRAQGGSLGSFLRYLERIKAHEGLAAQELGDRDDVVRIMSIHKSKGLQFPVVFVAGMGQRFGNLDARKPLALHSDLGASMQHVDPDLRTRRVSFTQAAIHERIRQQSLAEDARVLYVAMTRAKKHLLLVGTPRANDQERWGFAQTPSMMASARSMLDWVVPVAQRSAHWQVLLHQKEQIGDTKMQAIALADFAETVSMLPQPDTASQVAQTLSWEPAVHERAPLKQSVSSLVRAEAKQGEREDAVQTMASLSRRPLFLEERGLTATERGDAVHAFLRAVSYDVQDLDQARRIMLAKGILSEEQAKTLPIRRLTHFLECDVWQRLRRAEIRHREWPFNLRVDREDGRTLLQGIIDCCFVEDGQWVILDYKTDRAEDIDATVEHYRPQLRHYADALERITGRPVKECLLCLLEREMTITV